MWSCQISTTIASHNITPYGFCNTWCRPPQSYYLNGDRVVMLALPSRASLMRQAWITQSSASCSDIVTWYNKITKIWIHVLVIYIHYINIEMNTVYPPEVVAMQMFDRCCEKKPITKINIHTSHKSWEVKKQTRPTPIRPYSLVSHSRAGSQYRGKVTELAFLINYFLEFLLLYHYTHWERNVGSVLWGQPPNLYTRKTHNCSNSCTTICLAVQSWCTISFFPFDSLLFSCLSILLIYDYKFGEGNMSFSDT